MDVIMDAISGWYTNPITQAFLFGVFWGVLAWIVSKSSYHSLVTLGAIQIGRLTPAGIIRLTQFSV